MNPGVPTTMSVRVSRLASSATEIPKSMTRGPSGASSTFEGFKSRCTTPAPWVASSASASPAPKASTDASGHGPNSLTARSRDSPGTYAVASHGGEPSGSAATTPAVKNPLTVRATATSRAKRRRNSLSPARSGRTTFTATARPALERPR